MSRNREKDNSQSTDIDSECSDAALNINSLSSSSRGPVAKKRKFNLAEFADSHTSNYPNIDEVARYEEKHLRNPAGDHDVESGEYISAPFSIYIATRKKGKYALSVIVVANLIPDRS